MTGPTPHFIIGGAPRSGTTYLAEALSRHPQVYMAHPLIPEPKVFLGPPQADPVYLARYAALFREAPPGAVLGEKTSNYLESGEALERIDRLLPRARLIFLVREPVARAYSNYLWTKKNGLETLSFEEAVACEGQRPNPFPADKAYARPFDYLCRGRYARLAEPYLRRFGPGRVRFFLYEDIQRSCGSFLRDIQEFLGLTAVPSQVFDVGVVNSASDQGPPLDPEVHQRLREQVRDDVLRFGQLTGLDVSSWGYAA